MERIKTKFCDFGKKIKCRLVDIDKTQTWLISQVMEKTGLFFDSSYLYKIMTGKNTNKKIIDAINEILGLQNNSTT